MVLHCSPRLRTKSLTDELIACRCISISLTALVDNNYRCYDRPFADIHPAILAIRRDARDFKSSSRIFSCRYFVVSSFPLFMLSPRLFPLLSLHLRAKESAKERKIEERKREKNNFDGKLDDPRLLPARLNTIDPHLAVVIRFSSKFDGISTITIIRNRKTILTDERSAEISSIDSRVFLRLCRSSLVNVRHNNFRENKRLEVCSN